MKKLIKRILKESDLRRIIKRVLNEDVDITLPNIKVDRGLLNIDGKTYRLQAEKLWKRWDIDIIKISIDEDGEVTLIAENPLTGTKIESKIRKVNFDKVVSGAENNLEEITVKNLEDREFFLVRV